MWFDSQLMWFGPFSGSQPMWSGSALVLNPRRVCSQHATAVAGGQPGGSLGDHPTRSAIGCRVGRRGRSLAGLRRMAPARIPPATSTRSGEIAVSFCYNPRSVQQIAYGKDHAPHSTRYWRSRRCIATPLSQLLPAPQRPGHATASANLFHGASRPRSSLLFQVGRGAGLPGLPGRLLCRSTPVPPPIPQNQHVSIC